MSKSDLRRKYSNWLRVCREPDFDRELQLGFHVLRQYPGERPVLHCVQHGLLRLVTPVLSDRRELGQYGIVQQEKMHDQSDPHFEYELWRNELRQYAL